MKPFPRTLCAALALAVAFLLVISTPARAQAPKSPAAINKAATLKYVNFPNMPTCITGSVESGDPAHGASVILGKLTPGCAIPWHFHTPNEQVMVVAGAVQFQMKDGPPTVLHRGDFVLAQSHHVHQAKCTGAVPCMMFVQSDVAFDIHYVDSTGAEIPPTEALKAGIVKTTSKPGK
jgi:quercetin dioxygenase-like cupin family protein